VTRIADQGLGNAPSAWSGLRPRDGILGYRASGRVFQNAMLRFPNWTLAPGRSEPAFGNAEAAVSEGQPGLGKAEVRF
jgi:hypothetical protein